MGMGGGVIQQAFAQAMSPNAYVNPGMFNAYSAQQPTPYQPAGSGYGAAPTGGASTGGDLAGRYEIRKMAQGGLAAAADHLATKGRGSDSTLVHMSPEEVQSLQTIAKAHGGSLTINPATGLYEAGFLKNILPAIAGAGLMMIPGMQAWGAGLIVGGAEALRTGDIGKGLTAGLGAYGGAGLGSAAGIGGSAAPATTTSAGTGLSTTGGVGSQTAGLSSGNLGASSANFGLNAGSAGTGGAAGLTSSANSLYAPNLGASTPGMTGSQIAKYGFAAATPMLNDALTPPAINPITPEKSSGKYISKDFQAYVPNQPDPYYRPLGLGYAAEGGVMPDDLSYAAGGMIDPMQRMPNGGLAALQGMRDGYSPITTTDGNIPQMADGGSIGGYSDGGRMLRGPGDGMSDSIPGVIGNKQPARLADGEFVVPADVVSHLGNGSTDAGAKRLYGMMDKVRKARTGTKKQGKQIKPEKYMPA
jgi:hypothetical protein